MDNPIDIQKVSTEVIIERIHECRNQRIAGLLNEQQLMQFLEDKFDTVLLSPIRMEFLKRDLIALKNSPLDLVHYSPLIKELKSLPTKEISLSLIDHEVSALYEKYRF